MDQSDREFDDWCDYYDDQRDEERIEAAEALDAGKSLTRRQVWVLFGGNTERYEQARVRASERVREDAA